MTFVTVFTVSVVTHVPGDIRKPRGSFYEHTETQMSVVYTHIYIYGSLRISTISYGIVYYMIEVTIEEP